MTPLTRRPPLGFAAALLLSACGAPLVSPDVAQSINVREVTVDTSGFQGIRGRQFDVSKDRLAKDVAAALVRELNADPATGNTDIFVRVTDVRLVSPGEAFVLGSNSGVGAAVSAKDSRSGAQVLAPAPVSALSEQLRIGGPIGVAMTPSAEQDYTFAISGFAKAVRRRLLQRD